MTAAVSTFPYTTSCEGDFGCQSSGGNMLISGAPRINGDGRTAGNVVVSSIAKLSLSGGASGKILAAPAPLATMRPPFCRNSKMADLSSAVGVCVGPARINTSLLGVPLISVGDSSQ